MTQVLDGVSSLTSFATQARTQNEKIIDKVYAAAQPGAVFGAPVTVGEYTVMTASEISAGGGFGFGMGMGPTAQSAKESAEADAVGGGGGGGGGGSMGRPVATIVIGPDGVKVRPIVDATKLAIAAIGAWGAVALVAMRTSARAAKR